MSTKISIIMPVYNTESYVGEAIESILNQSFTDFEFIIIDDCSSDNSYEICQKYAKKDKRIKLFKNQNNMGISFTRNKLISLSSTNFITSQDSDDISFLERIKVSYDFLLNNPGYGVVSGNNEIIDMNGNILGYRKYCDNIGNVILKKSPISQPSSMFRKDIFYELGGYDKDLNYGEDYDLWLKMYSNGYGIKNLSAYLIKYRIHLEQSKNEKLKDTLNNTIFIQKRAICEYGVTPKIGDRIYIFLEVILGYFPNSFILFLFKKTQYSNEKR